MAVLKPASECLEHLVIMTILEDLFSRDDQEPLNNGGWGSRRISPYRHCGGRGIVPAQATVSVEVFCHPREMDLMPQNCW